MKISLQVSTLLKRSVKSITVIAVCLLALTQFTYSQDYDLALINGISTSFGPDFCPGDKVRLNAAVYNVGDIEACNVEITTYLPEGMTVSADDLNDRWEVDGSIATTIIEECIPPGGIYPTTGTLQLSLIQIISDSFTGSTINFYSEISADDGDDIDSEPDQDPDNDEGAEPNTDTDNSINNRDDEDDHDVAQITLQNCPTAGCTDPCAPNYDEDATVDNDSCDSYDRDCNRDICDGDVEEWDSDDCECVVVEESVTGCTDDDANNYDPDANCSDNGRCTYDPTGDYDLSLIMGISTSFSLEYCPGDEVRINMGIYNQGDIDACDVDVSVYIPEGMSLSSHPINDMWSGNGSIITTTIADCVSDGGVYPNSSRNPLSVRLVIDEDFDGSSLSTYAEISADDGRDIDSTPDDDPDNDAGADPSNGTDNTIHGQRGDEDDHDVQEISVRDCGFGAASFKLGNKQSAITVDGLYPTLVSSNLNLVVDADKETSTTVQIINLEGKVISTEVFQLKQSLNGLNLDVSNLANGTYFINLISGAKLITNKFVKN